MRVRSNPEHILIGLHGAKCHRRFQEPFLRFGCFSINRGTVVNTSCALPHWLPRCAAVQRCAQVSVPCGPHGRSSNQEPGLPGVLQSGLCRVRFLAFSVICLKVSKSGKEARRGYCWSSLVCFKNGAEDGTFGHPIRDAPARVVVIQWFSHTNAKCHVVTWCGPLT